MVIAYRLHWLTHWIFTRFKLIKSPFVSLANMLAGKKIAPEILQDDVQPEILFKALSDILESDEIAKSMQEIGDKVHRELRLNASSKAADAVLELLQSKQQTVSGC
jgi:lipid-A-disaccharide synthase